MNNDCSNRDVLSGKVMASIATTFSAVLGSLMASAFIKLTGVANADPTNFAGRLAKGVLKGMNAIGLKPYFQEPLTAGTTAITTLSVASNVLVDSIFSWPVRVTMGIISNLSTKNRHGQEFSNLSANAVTQAIRKKEVKRYGILYDENDIRPAVGAFVLIPDAAVIEMFSVLSRLGLRKLEDSISADLYFKPIVHLPDNHVAETPLEGGMIFDDLPLGKRGVQVTFRIIVMDPMFINENQQNLNLKDLPEDYVVNVLNTLDPMAVYKILGPAQLEPLLERAGNYAQTFKARFVNAVKKWQNVSVPKTREILYAYLQQGILHEFSHVLALSMPDKIPEDLPAVERERLNKFSVTAYIDFLSKSTELHTSVVYVKNLIKALQSVQNLEPSKATQNQVVRILAVEMFCDRFAMYMYELYLKMQAYEQVMKLGDISLDTVRLFEKQRRNRTAFMLVNDISEPTVKLLEDRLAKAEEEHVYISNFKDPRISEGEHAIFEPLLDLLRHFDREKTINIFTVEHTKGDFFRATNNEQFIAENKLGLDNVVKQTDVFSGIEGSAGASVTVGREVSSRLTQPDVKARIDQPDDWLNEDIAPVTPIDADMELADENEIYTIFTTKYN